MKIIQTNPYRIAGILSNATAREIQKQKGKIKAFSKVGKEITSEFDFDFLNPIERTEHTIEKAFSNIEQNQDKVNNSLFWFLKSSPFDETAISYLIKGDNEKAKEIWGKVTNEKEVNSKNFSAFNNIGTLKLLSKSEFEIKEGIEAKIKLIESEYFENFVHTVADQTFTIDNKKQSQKLIDELLTQFKNQYSSANALDLFSNCNGSTQKYLSKKFTEEPIHNIESNIESTKRKRKSNKSDAYKFGNSLIKNTKEDLSLLKSLLGVSDLNYKRVADELAKEIMQCGIDYFNENQDLDNDIDFLENSMKLAKLAETIAVGKFTKDKAKDNINSLKEMKDRELNQAIQLLQSVKDAYETNEANIRRQIEELKENDIELKFGLKTINYSAVEDNIKNSIDWSKVNDLLREVLSDKNLIKIKESSKIVVKNEFWDLINWLEDNSLKSSTISAIISKYKKIAPKIFFDITSANISNIDSNSNSITEPFYIENIRYVGLKLNINSKGKQEVTIFKKYVNPEGKYKHSSNSPEGYTTSTTRTITSQTKVIDLGGYGNSEECTYQVGEHKIDVYVDHFKVHSETFKVDWSPSKKAELKRKLEVLQNELNEVQKFKWFRGSETKQREVREVQSKIDKTRKILMNK